MNGIQRSNDGMSLDKDCSQGSEVTRTSPLLLCRSLKVLPKTLKKIGTFLKTLQTQFVSKLNVIFFIQYRRKAKCPFYANSLTYRRSDGGVRER